MFNNNNPRALQNELTGLSKVMGRPDVQTQFQGDGAWTDNNIVSVPAMRPDAQLTPREMAAMRGYHIHEVAHVTDTDTQLWEGKRPTPRKRSAWNAMEDVFIERKAQEQYVGARKNLQATADMVLERENKIDAEMAAEGKDPYAKWYDQIDYATLQLARKQMGYESPALDEYIDNLPDELMHEASKFVDDALACDSTEDTFKLSGKILRRMNALGRDDEEQQQQQQAQGGGGQGDKQDDNGQGDGNESGEGSDPSKTSGGEGTSGEERMQRANDAAAHIAGKYAPDGEDFERRPAMVFKSYEAYRDYIVENMEMHAKHLKRGHEDRIKHAIECYYHNDYSDLLQTLHEDRHMRAYASRIARLLLAREDKRFVGGQLEGIVDRRRLTHVVAGARNVFGHDEVMRTDNTIVSVAIDASGSMETTPTRLATACLNECLLKANVDYEVLAWTGYSGSPYDIMWTAPNLPTGIAPFNTNGLVELKTVAQRGNNPDVRKKIANVCDQVGVTPTYATVESLSHRMLSHNYERRIVLLITDGMPNGGYKVREGVRKLVDAASQVGIEYIGIGIECDIDNMREMFGERSVACNFRNLGTTLLGQIERLLLGKAHEAA